MAEIGTAIAIVAVVLAKKVPGRATVVTESRKHGIAAVVGSSSTCKQSSRGRSRRRSSSINSNASSRHLGTGHPISGQGSGKGRLHKFLRVQVPNNDILTQNLYHNLYYPKPKSLIIGYLDPLRLFKSQGLDFWRHTNAYPFCPKPISRKSNGKCKESWHYIGVT